MNIKKVLQELKRIEPDAAYTAHSRSRVLCARGGGALRRLGLKTFVADMLQYGFSMAAAAFLIMIMLGGFSILKFFEPLRLSSLDPAGLQAEAQAVDVQIRIANVSFREAMSTSPIFPHVTPEGSAGNRENALAPPAARATSSPTTRPSSATEATSSPESQSIDQALDLLSN